MLNIFRSVGCSLLLLASLSAPGFALVDEGQVARAKQAADEFLRLAEGSEKTGVVPRRSVPAVAKLLDTVFDLGVAGTETAPIDKIGPIGELARNGNRVGLVYILAGTGLTDPSGADAETLQKVDRNTVTFAPEMGQFTDFQIGATESMARSALAFEKSAAPGVLERPNIKAGLAQMKGGFAQAIGGVLKTLTIRDLGQDWKAGRLARLDGIADTASRFLDEPQKQSVKTLADEVAALGPPELRSRIEAFGQRIAAQVR